MGPEGLMVSVSGIRGRVGEALTPEVVAQLRGRVRRVGAGSGRLASRSSSAATAACRVRCSIGVVVAALQSVGVRRRSTSGSRPRRPASSPSSITTRPAGSMISASHNPDRVERAQVHRLDGTLSRREPKARRCARSSSGGFPRATWERARHRRRGRRGAARHIDAVLALPFIDVEGIRARRFTSRSTACRGAGAVIMPVLLERLGLPGQRRSTWSRTAAFRARRSRSPRTLASSKRWCSRAGRTSASRSIPTSTAWRSSRRGTGDRRGLHARAGGASRAATPAGHRWSRTSRPAGSSTTSRREAGGEVDSGARRRGERGGADARREARRSAERATAA